MIKKSLAVSAMMAMSTAFMLTTTPSAMAAGYKIDVTTHYAFSTPSGNYNFADMGMSESGYRFCDLHQFRNFDVLGYDWTEYYFRFRY